MQIKNADHYDTSKFSLERLGLIRELPISPQNLVQVLELLKQESPPIKALTAAVLKDPVLTALVTKAISGLKKTGNAKGSLVSQAIIHLGSKNLSKLFCSVNTYDMLNKIHSRGYFNLNQFWEESLATALFAKLLADKCHYPSGEQAYVAGLTHHLGVLAMHETWPEDYERVLELIRSGGDPHNCERLVFGFTHEEAGEIVAEAWGLPGSISKVIAGHHRQSKSPQQKSGQILSDIVYVATQLTPLFLSGKTASRELIRNTELWLEISELDIASVQTEILDPWEKIRLGLSLRDEDLELYAQLLEKTIAHLEYQLEDQEKRFFELRDKLKYLELQQDSSSVLLHCRTREETIQKTGHFFLAHFPIASLVYYEVNWDNHRLKSIGKFAGYPLPGLELNLLKDNGVLVNCTLEKKPLYLRAHLLDECESQEDMFDSPVMPKARPNPPSYIEATFAYPALSEGERQILGEQALLIIPIVHANLARGLYFIQIEMGRELSAQACECIVRITANASERLKSLLEPLNVKKAAAPLSEGKWHPKPIYTPSTQRFH